MKELQSVTVPEAFDAAFRGAERYVEEWFRSFEQDPHKGVITIGGERYILVRAASMSVHFSEHIRSMYPGLEESEGIAVVNQLLFDIAHSIGENDARNFHEKMGVADPIEKMSTGPIHFAWSGWAYVEILSETPPSPDRDFHLVYDHPQSFESDAWLATGTKTKHCVCHMNAGYSSGWCSESFGRQLVAREILCRARGDEHCRFVMADPSRIEDHCDRYLSQYRPSGDGA